MVVFGHLVRLMKFIRISIIMIKNYMVEFDELLEVNLVVRLDLLNGL